MHREHSLDEGEDSVNDVVLRAATQADAGFLYDVLKATMQAYVAQTWGWDERDQQARFRQEFEPGADRIMVLDGEDIGVISVERRTDEVFLDKIYILPRYQGRGIGSELINGVLAQAFGRDLPVTLRVLKVNPAKRLYERLGFVEVGETDASYLMKAMPPSAQ